MSITFEHLVIVYIYVPVKLFGFTCCRHVKGTSCLAGLSSLDSRMFNKVKYVHMFGENHKISFFTAWSGIPKITYYADCDEDEHLCLEVDFEDGGQNEVIYFDEIDDCVYSGGFEDEEVTAAASSVDCPMEENSMLQVNLCFEVYLIRNQ